MLSEPVDSNVKSSELVLRSPLAVAGRVLPLKMDEASGLEKRPEWQASKSRLEGRVGGETQASKQYDLGGHTQRVVRCEHVCTSALYARKAARIKIQCLR